MSDSFYDQFSGHESPQVETPFANREDMTKPYTNGRSVEDRAPEEVQEDKSYYGWWRFASNRQPISDIERQLAGEFNRSALNGHNFDETRDKYTSRYKAILKG